MKSCQILVDSLSFTWIARLRLSGLDHQRVWHRPRHGGRVKTIVLETSDRVLLRSMGLGNMGIYGKSLVLSPSH